MSMSDFQSTIEVEHIHDAVVVNFSRRIDLAQAFDKQAVENLLRSFVQAKARQLILNLGNVENLSSMGVAQLMGLDKRLKAAEGRLILTNLNPMMREILHSTKLDTLLTMNGGNGHSSVLGADPGQSAGPS